MQREHNTALASAEAHHQHVLTELNTHHAVQLQAIEDRWRVGVAALKTATSEIGQEALRWFPAWKELAAEGWTSLSAVPPAVKLGQITIGLKPPAPTKEEAEFSDNIPKPPLEPTFLLPAVASSPAHLSLLLEARGDGRRAAMQTLQAYMLRLATSLPPAKCRFTIIDPVGLGENFAAFMHLADYDDQLISRRIWTDPRHIEQRLTDLSEHMENVIQKYLRNEFKSIDEYNQHAEEVAEPFRFLVIANFPSNFTEAAARRLLSIAASGPRCGVFTLIARRQ